MEIKKAEPPIMKAYELLLDSWGFNKWTREWGYLVYSNADGIRKQLSQLFTPIYSGNIMENLNLWFYNDCAIKFRAENDKELPGNPLCFGKIEVIGREKKVDEVNKILKDAFKELDKLSKKIRLTK